MIRLLHSKWFPPQLPPPLTFQDHTILITGATGGLGLETAVHYIDLGASRVLITGRTLARANSAKATIEARTGTTGLVDVLELDMSSFAGVKSFADALAATVQTIDVVLLNAGLYPDVYHQSPEGWEEAMQVNTLSTVLLGLLLLPWMRASGPSSGARRQHLGFVGSGLHTKPRIDGGDFPTEKILEYWSEEAHFSSVPGSYARSKLFLMYGVSELVKIAAEGDASPSPIINTMCPGLCKSDLGRNYRDRGFLMGMALAGFLTTFARSAESGARTLVLAATTGPEEHGKYVKHYDNEEYAEQAARVLTSEEAKKLQSKVWHEMLQIFETTLPGVTKIAFHQGI